MIDLKRFKKIETDDKCTTLQHENGHQLKIAHKGLSDDHLKELKEMPMHLAKGGRAKFSQMYDPNMKGSKASKPSSSANTMPGSPTKAENAYTEPQDQGEKPPMDIVYASMHKEAPPFGPMGAEKPHSPPCVNPSCKSFGKPHPNCRCYGGKLGMYGGYAEGGEVKNFCEMKKPHAECCEYFKDGGEANPMPTPPPQDISQPDADLPGAAPAALPSPNERPQYNMTAPENINQVSPNPEMSAQGAPPPEDKGNDVSGELKAAEDAAGPMGEDPLKQPLAPIQQFQDHKDANLNHMFPEAQAFQADLDNGHIQPKTYSDLFHKKDTLGKIGTIFGLLLGGAGSGLSGQPNMLLEMMNKQIDNDLHAQQNSVSNKQNFLKINQQNVLNQAQAKNLNVEAQTKAFALAKVQMNMAALHKLVTDTQKLPDGPQKQQALQTLAMMNQGVQNENFNILDRAASSAALAKTLFGDQGGQPNTTMMKSGLMGPEAKEMGSDVEQKSIPGIPGRAGRPIPQNTRDELQAMDVLSKKAADLMSFAKSHKGTLSPSQRALGEQKAAEMVNFYNQSLGAGILTQGRLSWLDQQIHKNPTSIFQDVLGNNKRLQEIKDSNDMRKNISLKNLGFNVPESKSSNPQSSPKEQTSKSGRPMIQKDGKWVYK